jgi:glutathione synthase/RimK-type ligase-like ATP-grasp enzyme
MMTTEESPQLLIVSTKVDLATDYVVLQLEELGAKFFRINCEDFPLAAHASYTPTPNPVFRWITSDNKSINLRDIRSVWFRRHRLPEMPPEMDRAHQDYCLREADWFIKGLVYSLALCDGDVRWMNHPERASSAESKIVQLGVAGALNFKVPETLVSNEPVAIRDFYACNRGEVVAKPLRLGYFDFGDRKTCVFTTRITEEHLNDDESLSVAPVIYQALINKSYDIRVTIVGTKVFAAAIDSQSIPSAVIDWRRSETEDLGHLRHELPSAIETKCLQLMKTLGLSFGALDLILTPQGEYVFLEVNPSGQWVWIEDKLDLPISRSIAEWLWVPMKK